MTDSSDQPVQVATLLFPAVVEMVRTAMGDYGERLEVITPSARLDADLRMESVEFATLGELLRERWGPAGDLTPLVRGLDPGQLAALTVGDVAAEVERRLAGPGPARRADPGPARP
jgi:hypothetical protein